MNRMNTHKQILKLMNFDKLSVAVSETCMQLDNERISSDLINKVISLNFTIVLAAQNKSISFAEYSELAYELLYKCALACYLDTNPN